jgi:hypothetical protein
MKKGRPCTFPSPWIDLVHQFPSVQDTANFLGTSPRTLHEWAHGTRSPTGAARKAIKASFVIMGILPPPNL